MKAIENAIRDAVEKGGYKDPRYSVVSKDVVDEQYAQFVDDYAKWTQQHKVLLDPIFWVSLFGAKIAEEKAI